LSTLNGLRVTSARVTIPAWGCWFADVQVDGEHTLAGAATLKVADATYVGTILSGGPALGRSSFRIVAGGGGWGRTIAEKSYANDATVKFSTVIGDAAAAAGETIAVIASTERTGPAYVRQAGPASDVLNLLAPQAWYVDEVGTTRLGARAASTLPAKVVRITPLDKALGKVVLAAESIAAILPGVVVDGMTAVDVEHSVSADGGLRSTVWGSTVPSSLDSFRLILDALDPWRKYRGVTEHRVGALEGNRLNLQPVRSSTGMPFLSRVPVWPGVGGALTTVALGSRVLVGFVDSDPGRPYVAGFEDADGEGFVPTSINLQAGGMVGGEHIMTVEACAVLLHNVIFGLGAAALPSAWLVPGAIVGIINAALAAAAVPAAPGLVAQAASAITIGGAMSTTPVVGNTSAPYAAAIAGISSKVSNVSGLFPSLGSKAVKAG
jgi:hypothetical protein